MGNKLKVGCSTLFLWEYPIEVICDIFKDAGLNCMEFFPENPEFWEKRDDLDYICGLKKEFRHFCLILHAPTIELNPSSTNDYVYEASIKETIWSINLAKLYGAKYITIHPGKRPTKRPPREKEYIKFYKYLDVVLDYAKKNGITLCLENLPKKTNYICYSSQEMEEVLNKYTIKNLKMTLDFAHAKEETQNFVDKLNQYIKNIHISGVVDGKDHYPLELSQIDFSKPVKDLIYKYNYKNCFNLEINDKNYKRTLSKDEKMNVIIKEVGYLENLIK
ncbi:sugar phosphate isomerase/epimerase [Methanothermococcus sp.]|uniref:sugar phosphate isomerase/epimerase family protein n=1 Tax=Methanothermococcus sp. TaxID=2614238 RepID=UPI0025DEE6EA|nr:sugar phosphate isomerase/epimerase [Methanothermococcus sp.]